MKKRIGTILLASALVLAQPLSAFAGMEYYYGDSSTTTSHSGGGGGGNKTSGGGGGNKTTNTGGGEAAKPAENTAEKVENAAKGEVLRPSEVTVALQNPNGSVDAVNMAAMGAAIDAALNDALRDASKLDRFADSFATSAALRDQLVSDLKGSAGKSARTVGTLRPSLVAQDGRGNTIASPGEYTGGLSDSSVFVLTSVDKDGTIERVKGVLVPVSDGGASKNMLYGAFKGEPSSITVTVIQ